MEITKRKEITNNLIDTFKQAGIVSLSLREKGLIKKIKDDNTPVSNGDIEVNNILIKKILSLTPEIPIISEETVDLKVKNTAKIFWLIDPIDGTREYIAGKDEYTLNAALVINKKPVLGVIYAPAKKRLFFSYGKNLAFEISNGKTKKLSGKKVKNKEIVGLEHSGKLSNEVLNIYKKIKSLKLLKCLVH